ncbi:MAG: (d)CMP kinase [Clostridiales Family XIII bacterium]|jgi:cytidylate kinase|nr:(d)CMP kinase [Clostridiales Family XIII bacterium]
MNTSSDRVRVAIDGPSGAGKSTVAKRVAEAIGADYIDTGAMYRAVALKLLRDGVDPASDIDGLVDLLSHTDINFTQGNVMLDGEDVTSMIRSPDVTAMASRCSAFAPVREKLVGLQRKMGDAKSVVMDGRDIGTNVFPDAEYKFYLTASTEERARRRYAEMTEAGGVADYREVLDAIKKRDYDDAHRSLNPLQRADYAILIDTDGMGIEEVITKILSYMGNTD